MSRLKEVVCDYCGGTFERPVNRANEANRKGWKQFCSKNCQRLSKTKKIKLKCSECGVDIVIRNNEYEKSKTKRFFCTKSCSAKYNNKGRKHSKKTKNKISSTLKLNRIKKNCPICNNSFEVTESKSNRVYCSVNCGIIGTSGSLPFTKEEVIENIKRYFVENGTAPSSKRVKKKLTGAACRFFGSWNNAMIELGIEPNTEWMIKKKIKCKDGHIADSISESLVDNWLYDNSINHELHKNYPGSKLNCDFYLPKYNIWLEYFGLSGENEEYDKKNKTKKELVKKLKLNLVEVYPSDLFPEIKIGELLIR